MSDDDLIRRGDGLVEQALAELQDVVHCRCHEAYTGRGLHNPDCQCDSQNAVHVVAAHIAALTAQNRELALDVLASSGQAQEAYAAQLAAKAEAAALRAKLARIASAWPIVRDADCSGGTLASAMDEIEAAISDGAADE